MAKHTTISNAAAKAACDAVVDLLDAGSGAGTLKIYTDTQPTNPDVAVTSQTLLATLTLSDPAFGSAADANPGGEATADTITSDSSADATGTAAWARASDSDGNGVIDGICGTSDADFIFDTVAFVAGAEISLSSWKVKMPETPPS